MVIFKLVGTLFSRLRYYCANALHVWQVQGLRALVAITLDKFRSSRDKCSPKAYQAWIDEFDTLRDSDRDAIEARVARFTSSPRISILMPVYNPPEKWLSRAIDSVLAQLYPDWELCIADDASTAVHVRPLLEMYQQRDSRIRVVYRQQNGHISAASNSALELATGEFAALLDHDDELSCHTLYLIAEELHRYPGTDILYSDEDKIDEKGRRFEPFFKAAWDPDLFLSQNYLSHLGVYRTSLMRAVGGFRHGFEGSQDYDLAIRCVAATEPNRIRHIPYVLYHWRATAGSTSLSTAQKGYAEPAAVMALNDYFQSLDSSITVEQGGWPTTYRVRYPLPDPAPRVSIIIPTRDRLPLLERCVACIREKTVYPDCELIIVDNRSSEPATKRYLEKLARNGAARVLKFDAEFNNSAINNFAVRKATGDVLCLLHNNVQGITPDWLAEMVAQAVRPEIGAVGAKLYCPDDTIQHAGVILGLMGVANYSHQRRSRFVPGYFSQLKVLRTVSAVTGACLVVRRELYERIGGLDDKNLPLLFNDVDFCLRLGEAGYRTLWTPYAELYHHESASWGRDLVGENAERLAVESAYMRKRWGVLIEKDPYYSPNLSLESNDFSLAWPPRTKRPWLESEGGRQ